MVLKRHFCYNKQMPLENTSNADDAEQSAGRAESSPAEATEEVSVEAIRRAKKTVEQTLEGIDSTHLITTLRASAKTLPQYRHLQDSLETVSPDALPEALFHELRTMPSQPKTPDSPEDGVLISSIRQGSLCCAGRVLLASTFLQEKGIPHSIISTIAGEGGHSVLLIEVSNETSAYCDAENGLYFTFPSEALEQRGGNQKVSINHLKDFVPKEHDVRHGLGSMSRTFMRMDADTGIAYQYLGNVQAALSGNKEFAKGAIQPDVQAAAAVSVLQQEQVGSDVELIEKFSEELYERGIPRQLEKDGEMRQLVTDVYTASEGSEEKFCDVLGKMFASHQVLTALFPYLQHASEDQRKEAAREMWRMAKSLS